MTPDKAPLKNNFDESPTKVYRIVKYSLFLFSLAFFLFAGSKILNDTIPTAGKTKKLPIYCVDTEEKKVALSFDAAWGNEDTRNILAILKKHNVKVTFFMTGEWMNKYPEDVKAILADGHDLGNHSENHKQMSQLSEEQCRTEIQKAHDRIKELTGVEMNLFRPPYGDYNNTLVDVCKDMGYHCIQWDIDSLDWKDYGSDAIIKKVLEHKHLGNGSIILMHNGAKYTPAALEAVILGLKEQGYELVPISELIYTENYEMDHEGRQHKPESVTPVPTPGITPAITSTTFIKTGKGEA